MALFFKCRCCCGAERWNDPFDSDLGGYTTYKHNASPVEPLFELLAGKLVLRNDPGPDGLSLARGTYYQTLPLPSSTCFGVCASANISRGPNGSLTCGIFFGGAMAFVGRQQPPGNINILGEFVIATDVTDVGESQLSPTIFFDQVWNDGDKIEMRMLSGCGPTATLTFKFLINDILLHERTAAKTLSDPINVGVFSTNGGSWDNFVIQTT